MQQVVIAGAARTPMGRFSGLLSGVPAPQLGATAIREAVSRAHLTPGQVDYVIMGNVLSAGLKHAPARQAAIAAGLPESTSALTVNKVCASGLTAVVLATQMVQTGDAEVVVAGGMENMSQAPHLLVNSRTGSKMGDLKLLDHMVHDGLWCPFENHHMGSSAEAIASKYGITRGEQDEFALRSHGKAVAAAAEGSFDAETVPVTVQRGKEKIVIQRDEGPRPDATQDSLAKLAPAFPPGATVTAGNSSQITDGAAAVVVMSARRCQELGHRPLATITGYSHAAVEPTWLFDAPVPAIGRLLERTGTRLEEYDLLEVNEAFAAQVLANGKVLEWDWKRVNVKGGAVALGHPIGASGARILVALLFALRERQARRGLAVICHGGGGAVAMAVEADGA